MLSHAWLLKALNHQGSPFRSGLSDKVVITQPTVSHEILEPGGQCYVQGAPPAISWTQIPIFITLNRLKSLWSCGQTVILARHPEAEDLAKPNWGLSPFQKPGQKPFMSASLDFLGAKHSTLHEGVNLYHTWAPQGPSVVMVPTDLCKPKHGLG